MTLRDPVQEKSVATYLSRLLNGVSRSAVLKAFPTRTVKRIDLSRFQVAHAGASAEVVQTLVNPDSTYRVVFRDYKQVDERGAESRALFTTLRSKLAREAEAAHRETGLWMLWLAYPLLYVPHPSPERDDYLLAPLFLWPIRIQTTGLAEGEINLKRESGAPRFNRIAWQWIRRTLEFDPPEPTGVDLLELQNYEDLRELVSKCCHGFRPPIEIKLGPQIVPVPTRQTVISWKTPRLLDSGVLGLIQWENMELMADLESLHQRDDLSGPAGDFLREQRPLTKPALDFPREEDRFLVTFADHSQERAIWLARRPEGVVVHGPPGTGKSQVIVNIVADAIAHGEKVLVVCQKKAALDVVSSRLRAVGLGELIMQVDDAEADRRRVVEMLRDQEPPRTHSVGERGRLAGEIERLEHQFEEYSKALFQMRDRYGVSYRSMLARIARIEREYNDVRPLQPVRQLLIEQTNGALQPLCEALLRTEELFWAANIPNNPWIHGKEALTGDRYELEEIAADLESVLPTADAIDAWAGQSGPAFGAFVGNLRTINEAGETLAKNWQSLNSRILQKVHASQPQALAIDDASYAAAAAATERVVERQHSFFRWASPKYCRALSSLRGFMAYRSWTKMVEARSVYYMIAHRAADAASCEPRLMTLSKWLSENIVNELLNSIRTGKRISDLVRGLKENLSLLPALLQYRATVQGLDSLGQKVVKAIEANPGGSPKNWAQLVELSALLSWVGQTEQESPILRRLTPELYDADRLRLTELAKKKRDLDSEAIRSFWAAKWATVDHRWRQGLRIRGPNSRRLREIVETGRSRGLFNLRPCWLANPGTVSQMFPLETRLFDLVIFDEASQCPPEYALPTLFRASRTVVAGDGKQLPPTMFFKAAFDFDLEETESDPADGRQDEEKLDLEISTGAEDLLSLAQARLPDSHLNVHYRSLDPVLIAFSNAAFYQNRLETPRPAKHITPNGEPALFLESVGGTYLNSRTNPSEARAVVDYVRRIWMIPAQPPTMGVVTFNDSQREAIEDLLDLEAERDPEFRMTYEREITRTDEGQDVGFFVKSLEAVQGDERDVILFSTTYGKREDGRFVRSFLGPINQQGGERRLNVAITRAKLWVRIFTSLPIHELASALTPGAVETQGAAGRAMLQLYLAYAEHITKGEFGAAKNILQRAIEIAGGLGEPDGSTGKEESEFEIEVREALRDSLQVDIDTQVSSGSFRIDLAVRAPNDGSYILGIECDGKAYHSAPSARAYDWWRQMVLEKRGWQIHRVWSTAWRTNRAREIEKVKNRLAHILREGRTTTSS